MTQDLFRQDARLRQTRAIVTAVGQFRDADIGAVHVARTEMKRALAQRVQRGLAT
jgi:hypothetical protein